LGDAGSLLIRAGLIRPEALEAARRARSESGGTLAEHLVLSGAVADETLTQFYRERLLVPRISDSKLGSLADDVVAQITADMAAEHRVIPVALDRDGNMTVAMSDPSDTHAVDELGFFTSHYVVRAVASQRQIAWALARYYDVMTPMAEIMLAEETGAATTEASDPVKPKRRPRSLSIQVAAARHKVVAPATRPPLEEPRPTDATIEHWEEAIAAARIEGTPARATTVRDVDKPTLEGDAPFIESLPDYLRAALEGPPPDEASISGVINAVAPPTDVAGDERREAARHESTIEVADQAIEMDADWADDDEELEPMAPLEDGSPPELAPRAGELLVNRSKSPSVGTSTPAVVLDETLMTTPLARSPAPDDPEPEPVTEIDADNSGADNSGADDSGADDSGAETATPEPIESEATEPYTPAAVDDDDHVGETIELEAEPLHDDDDDDGDQRELEDSGAYEEYDESDDYDYDYEDEDDDDDSTALEVSDLEEIDELSTADFDLIEEPATKRTRERGTDSAPFLLSELAPTRREPHDTEEMSELVTLPLAEPEAEPTEDVVLLDMPKQRSKRTTAVGIGLPEAELAAIRDLDRQSDRRGPVPTPEPGPEPKNGIGLPAPITPPSPLRGRDERSQPETPDLEDQSAARLLDTLEALQRAADRDGVISAVLDYLEANCERVAFFALKQEVLTPWQVRTPEPVRPRPALLSFDRESTLREIVETRLSFAGPIADQPSRQLIAAVFGSVAPHGLAVPVSVRGRVVGLLYAEGTTESLRADNVALVTRAAGRALERVLRRKPIASD
jgi:hypothetical protein